MTARAMNPGSCRGVLEEYDIWRKICNTWDTADVNPKDILRDSLMTNS